MDHTNENMHHTIFKKDDRVSYKGKEGVVSRINILGFRPCCAIEVQWTDGSMKTILKMKELEQVVKL
jgi:hypothetical protein